MKFLLTVCLGIVIACNAKAGDTTAFIPEPAILQKIITGVADAKIYRLTSKISEDDGRTYSYCLRSASYLGTIQRGDQQCILGTMGFIRSSAKGREQPSARSHGFLVCLSPDFKLLHHCRLDVPDAFLVGDKLMRGEKLIGDFSANEANRTRGFLIDNDDFLPYPFSDRLKAENGLKSD